MNKNSKLKAAILFLIFEVIWNHKEKWTKTKVTYRFRLKPRIVSTTIICILIMPYYLIRYGTDGVVHLFKTAYDPVGAISFHFIRDDMDDRPSIWEAYQKFYL